jgi:hypothetical protein
MCRSIDLFCCGSGHAGGAARGAQMRALSDPVVAYPDPESLSRAGQNHRNKQATLHIMRELLRNQ